MFLIKRNNYLGNNLLINLSEIQITDNLKKLKFDDFSLVDYILNINEKEKQVLDTSNDEEELEKENKDKDRDR